MKKTIIKLISILIVMTLTLSACEGAAVVSSADKAADFTLPTSDGKTVSLADFKGKPVFLNFWETT